MTTVATTEATWQAQVLELAHLYGWHVCHVRRSIGKGRRWTTATSVVGWPDLVLWHERQRRVIFAELKTDTGRLTDDQRAVLGSLEAAGQEAYVWRPALLDAVATMLAPAGT